VIHARLTLGLFSLAIAAVAFAVPAVAGFTRAQLASISASPPANAVLPLDLSFRDENGRIMTLRAAIGAAPAVVVFADYTCRTLCGPILEFTAAGLANTGLQPGTDYRLVVIGLNPRDGLDAARAMRAEHIGRDNPVSKAAILLSGGDADIRATAQSVGLSYAYDAEHDQYAHPAAVYVVDSVGRVRRVLSPLGLDGGDLRLSIIDAGHGTVGTIADRLHLLCYGFDPVRGVYTERITAMLECAAGATLAVLAAFILIMLAGERRKAAT